MKKTLVLGASLKTNRYSNYAIHSLTDKKHEVVGVGLKEGKINGVTIYTGMPKFENIHTITLYLNPKRQKDYYKYIVSLRPQRVIFNPGTNNKELENILEENKIFYENSCTLVLLSTGQY
jgi:predicted CoA-binding protein